MSHLASLEITHLIARDQYHAFIDPDRSDETAKVCRWLAAHYEEADQVFVAPGDARDFRAGLALATNIFGKVHHALTDDGEMAFVETEHFGPAIIFDCAGLPDLERRTLEIYSKQWSVRFMFPQAGSLIRRFDSFDAFAEAYEVFHEAREREALEVDAELARAQDHAVTLKSLTPAMVDRIKAAWSRESAMDPDGWSEDNPAKDQCAVTAALIYELVGLDVVRGHAYLPDGRVDSHYWNQGVDLTLTQYPEHTVTRRRNGVQGKAAYEYLRTNPDLVRRLDILRARYEAG